MTGSEGVPHTSTSVPIESPESLVTEPTCRTEKLSTSEQLAELETAFGLSEESILKKPNKRPVVVKGVRLKTIYDPSIAIALIHARFHEKEPWHKLIALASRMTGRSCSNASIKTFYSTAIKESAKDALGMAGREMHHWNTSEFKKIATLLANGSVTSAEELSTILDRDTIAISTAIYREAKRLKRASPLFKGVKPIAVFILAYGDLDRNASQIANSVQSNFSRYKRQR